MIGLLPAFLAAVSSAMISVMSKKTMQKTNYYVVAWALMALSAPFFLALLFFVEIPALGALFWPSVLVHVVLFLFSIVVYMKALGSSDLSLILPMLSFTPIFILILGPMVLGEFPSPIALLGIFAIVSGAYLLSVRHARHGFWGPVKSLIDDKGAAMMLAVSFLWALMAMTSKLAVTNSSPVFALVATYSITAVLSTVIFSFSGHLTKTSIKENFPSLFVIGVLSFIGNVGLYYAFTLTLAVHAIAVKRLSILIGSIFGFVFLGEKNASQRLLGSMLMVIGVFLMAL